MKLTKETKQQLFATYGGTATNTGSAEGQIALFTDRINHISGHLTTNKKDHSNTRALLKLVGQRKRMLKYLAKTNLNGYRALIEKLGIRR
ncbi:MAG: ribosomal protein S15p [Bacteroidetes bacterium]|nr:ribosomal protein S15p [Bacteroidota bacterium]